MAVWTYFTESSWSSFYNRKKDKWLSKVKMTWSDSEVFQWPEVRGIFLKKTLREYWGKWKSFMWITINSGNRSGSCSENCGFRIAQVVGCHSEKGISVFREWNFEFRELLREYPGTLRELREWPFHSESVFPEIGVVSRLLNISSELVFFQYGVLRGAQMSKIAWLLSRSRWQELSPRFESLVFVGCHTGRPNGIADRETSLFSNLVPLTQKSKRSETTWFPN